MLYSINHYINHPANTKSNSDGALGGAFELAVKDCLGLKLTVSRSHSFDVIAAVDGKRRHFEVKQGSGGLGNCDKKGNSFFIYCPVIVETLPVNEQEAFVVPRADFIKLLHDVGLYREGKKMADGKVQNAINTVWIRKTNKPHSVKKYNALIDALYTYGTPLEEWLTDNGFTGEG